MNISLVSLVAVYIYIYIYIYTATICSLEDKTSIFPYALLKLHARYG